MNDVSVIRKYKEAVQIFDSLGIKVTDNGEIFSVEKYAKDGNIILFENFHTVAELIAFVHGFVKGHELVTKSKNPKFRS